MKPFNSFIYSLLLQYLSWTSGEQVATYETFTSFILIFLNKCNERFFASVNVGLVKSAILNILKSIFWNCEGKDFNCKVLLLKCTKNERDGEYSINFISFLWICLSMTEESITKPLSFLDCRVIYEHTISGLGLGPLCCYIFRFVNKTMLHFLLLFFFYWAFRERTFFLFASAQRERTTLLMQEWAENCDFGKRKEVAN